MVAKITFPRSAEKALRYNERKVLKGVAICLGGDNYLTETQLLRIDKKLAILQYRNALNDRATTNTIHISLNFSSSEILSEIKLNNIASFYMEKMGFGEQPYFVYQHHDAGHPHIHIVSTIIRQDGKRISTHNIGRNQSEKAREETEKHFGLMSVDRKKKRINESILELSPDKALYGKGETRKNIARVLEAVISHYNYTSLTELNAILFQYNVAADRGKLNSGVHKRRGLYYRILNGKGNKIGVPVKASALPGKPTLSFLEKRFLVNQSNRIDLKRNLIQSLDDAIRQNPQSTEDLKHLLAKKGIAVSVQTKSEGENNTVAFISNHNKYAFDSRELSDYYSRLLQKLPLEIMENAKGLVTEDGSLAHTSNRSTKQSVKQKSEKSKNEFLKSAVNRTKARQGIAYEKEIGKRNKGLII